MSSESQVRSNRFSRSIGDAKGGFAGSNDVLLPLGARSRESEIQELPLAQVREAKCRYTRCLLGGDPVNLARTEEPAQVLGTNAAVHDAVGRKLFREDRAIDFLIDDGKRSSLCKQGA